MYTQQHIPRDQNLDSNGSTPFQAHQSLGHALGNHPHLAGPYARPQPDYRQPSNSPPTLNQPGAPAQNHAGPSGVHQTMAYPQVNGQTSPALKRKQMDNQINMHVSKRRRDDDDSFDMGEGGQGAKHWTDEEKTRLFTWLMGPGNTEHWNSLRATKNSCLRECATEIFEGKKTYQALKGCYERNFNVFKQVYACETFNQQRGVAPSPNETERLREYERRIQNARKASIDIGNITARNLEHWYSRGWYQLFFDRRVLWHGDPATTKPVVARAAASANAHNGGADDGEDEDMPGPQPPNSSTAIEFPQADPTLLTNALTNGLSHDRPPPAAQHPHHGYINAQTLGNANNNRPEHPLSHPQVNGQVPIASGSGGGDTPAVSLSMTPQMLNTFMQFCQAQTHASKVKMEYLRRREEREEKEHRTRLEAEQLRLERDRFELEQLKNKSKLVREKAFELLSANDIDPGLKKAASEYVRKMLSEE
ncbi:hypothetical protein BKA70DRAFT_1097106 [Coprinopsis sp. MPI-PUGE-AT-0042]|nr:hypothetical protein BKA70DRAFT_1097106 [Coprinopsis sp. MPI-PUGE-AT-0042]